MIKLLVMSVLTVSEKEFEQYSSKIPTIYKITKEEFMETLKSGEKLTIKFSDKEIVTFEIKKDN